MSHVMCPMSYVTFGDTYTYHISPVNSHLSLISLMSPCPPRVMSMVGVKTLVVTNAVGSINPSYQVPRIHSGGQQSFSFLQICNVVYLIFFVCALILFSRLGISCWSKTTSTCLAWQVTHTADCTLL